MSAFASSPSPAGTAFITMISLGNICRVRVGLTDRMVDMTLLLLAAISVLYRLRNRFGGGIVEPKGTMMASAGAWEWAF